MALERFASSFVGIKKMAFAQMTAVGSSSANPTYGQIYLCDGLVGVNPEADEEPEVHFVNNSRWRYQPSKLKIEKTALTPEYQVLMLGQTITSGVLSKKLSDESPLLALLWETEQANKKRVRWLLPCVRITSAEPTQMTTKGESLEFDHFTLSGLYWHTLSGVKYRRAHEELDPTQFANWFTAIQL